MRQNLELMRFGHPHDEIARCNGFGTCGVVIHSNLVSFSRETVGLQKILYRNRHPSLSTLSHEGIFNVFDYLEIHFRA